eukprot:TRINITY_DN1918_c0_g1_i5.p1 TRINITY_DN1918_c0_g1~~TRINITY_DN1918_c0_g1_i5.p1  ORF type:complete len:494 (-),score=187.62 TRINITY_DN1918_c0_g1_i5:221-1702(-)
MCIRDRYQRRVHGEINKSKDHIIHMFRGGFPGFPGAFFGGGGAPDDGGDDSPQGKGEPDTKLYDLLGLGKEATPDEVKKAFRKKAVTMHPDKGGDSEKFAELNEAYEILSNAEKREMYDKYGLEAARSGSAPGGGFGDIFDLLGGRMGGGHGAKKAQKVKPTLRELSVKLEDVYKGRLINMPIERKRVCESCDGKGGANVKTCGGCKGRGVVEKIIQFAPGMYQHSSQPCGECRGQGKTIDEKDKCQACKGQKIVNNKKNLEVAVEQGVPDEHQYVFHGEGDELPGVMAGDIVVRIKIEKHAQFQRKGADLLHEKKISLLEALSGFNFELEHLDGRKVTISTLPGEVISHEQTKTVKNKGMPFYKDAMSHGHLYIRFKVEFPKRGQLKAAQIEQLKTILPGPKTSPLEAKKNVEFLEDFDETDMNSNPEGGKGRGRDDDDDEDMPQGGQRVQCAHQQGWRRKTSLERIFQNKQQPIYMCMHVADLLKSTVKFL